MNRIAAIKRAAEAGITDADPEALLKYLKDREPAVVAVGENTMELPSFKAWLSRVKKQNPVPKSRRYIEYFRRSDSLFRIVLTKLN